MKKALNSPNVLVMVQIPCHDHGLSWLPFAQPYTVKGSLPRSRQDHGMILGRLASFFRTMASNTGSRNVIAGGNKNEKR